MKKQDGSTIVGFHVFSSILLWPLFSKALAFTPTTKICRRHHLQTSSSQWSDDSFFYGENYDAQNGSNSYNDDVDIDDYGSFFFDDPQNEISITSQYSSSLDSTDYPSEFFNSESSRNRFPVRFVPPEIHPPKQKPSWEILQATTSNMQKDQDWILEQAEKRIRRTSEKSLSTSLYSAADVNDAASTFAASIAIGALSGMWMMAPILYIHYCDNDIHGLKDIFSASASSQLPMMLIISGLESSLLVGMLELVDGGGGNDPNQAYSQSEDHNSIDSRRNKNLRFVFGAALFLRPIINAILFLGSPAMSPSHSLHHHPVEFDLLLESIEACIWVGTTTVAWDVILRKGANKN